MNIKKKFWKCAVFSKINVILVTLLQANVAIIYSTVPVVLTNYNSVMQKMHIS